MEKVLFFYYEWNGVPKAQRIQFKFQVPIRRRKHTRTKNRWKSLYGSYFNITSKWFRFVFVSLFEACWERRDGKMSYCQEIRKNEEKLRKRGLKSLSSSKLEIMFLLKSFSWSYKRLFENYRLENDSEALNFYSKTKYNHH